MDGGQFGHLDVEFESSAVTVAIVGLQLRGCCLGCLRHGEVALWEVLAVMLDDGIELKNDVKVEGNSPGFIVFECEEKAMEFLLREGPYFNVAFLSNVA